MSKIKIIGIDPGLVKVGWGMISKDGNSISYIAHGTIRTNSDFDIATRLNQIYTKLCEVIREYSPDEASIEETFMNNNAASALKLGTARGVAILAPAHNLIPVHEYGANKVKKSVTGFGHASKEQIGKMVGMLLSIPEGAKTSQDALDALAIAICHANHMDMINLAV